MRAVSVARSARPPNPFIHGGSLDWACVCSRSSRARRVSVTGLGRLAYRRTFYRSASRRSWARRPPVGVPTPNAGEHPVSRDIEEPCPGHELTRRVEMRANEEPNDRVRLCANADRAVRRCDSYRPYRQCRMHLLELKAWVRRIRQKLAVGDFGTAADGSWQPVIVPPERLSGT